MLERDSRYQGAMTWSTNRLLIGLSAVCMDELPTKAFKLELSRRGEGKNSREGRKVRWATVMGCESCDTESPRYTAASARVRK